VAEVSKTPPVAEVLKISSGHGNIINATGGEQIGRCNQSGTFLNNTNPETLPS
jgi:hypothetical protein